MAVSFLGFWADATNYRKTIRSIFTDILLQHTILILSIAKPKNLQSQNLHKIKDLTLILNLPLFHGREKMVKIYFAKLHLLFVFFILVVFYLCDNI
ncbi:MAG: hypothetical protein ACD_7C00369G0016 [uncultured bacterium]|nr:MAG: hypothetical protein ACD_7C00369G0016 [uncultured bacterium]HBR79040.1 hypothetical protein [Candidatus Moranbacteria bacterium]